MKNRLASVWAFAAERLGCEMCVFIPGTQLIVPFVLNLSRSCGRVVSSIECQAHAMQGVAMP